jgi:hypothetical protein
MQVARCVLGASALVVLGAGAALGQQAKAPAIDPAAITALNKMGEFLRKHPNLQIKADTSTDEVLESGQTVQLDAQVELSVRRPDRLRLNKVSDRKTREFFFDGKTFTMFAPKDGYYTQFPAPPNLQQLVELLGRRYGIDLPLADLFYWGTDKSGIADVRAAVNIGPSTVLGAKCDHYALRQRDVDWQIWIQQGAEPLPRKLVVTNVEDPARPQHEVAMTWTLNPTLDDKLFVFVPPKDAHPIEIEDAEKLARPARQGRPARPAGGGTP